MRPDCASTGIWVKAKTPDKGIESWLSAARIEYRSLAKLGNIFLGFPDWQQRYRNLLDSAGGLLTERLMGVSEPYCLLCAEKRAADRHRLLLAEYLATQNAAEVQHLE